MTRQLKRRIGPFSVMPVGLGCMNLSHAYGPPVPEAQAAQLLLHALDAGVDFLDTAALYGFGANESLIGRILRSHRDRYVLASKCGMTGVNGKRVIDGRPATIKATCEEALTRLQTEVIDLYYLHRLDFNVPIEDSVGAMADLVKAGKIRAIGLSEISATTLRRAHAVHPIAAVQSEYSLWARESEIAVITACREIGATFVAFSPLGRGFWAARFTDPAAELTPGDIRLSMPRFMGDHFPQNRSVLKRYLDIARQAGCSPAQLALAWILSTHPDMIVIPGTVSIDHLNDNLGALRFELSPQILSQLEEIAKPGLISGGRYNEATLKEIDTEQFPAI